MAIKPPPPKKPASEDELDALINKGGTVSQATKDSSSKKSHSVIKCFAVKMYASTLEEIDEMREKRPRKPMSPKKGISTQDWIMEAINEKLEREKKKYNHS